MAIFLALLGAFFFGILSVLTRRALRVAPDPVTGAFVTDVVALGAAAAVAAIAGSSLSGLTWHSAWPFLLAGLFVPGVSQILFVYAIKLSGPARTSTAVGVAPLISAFIAIVVLDEPLNGWLLLGSVLVVAGVVSLAWERTRPEHVRAFGLVLAAACAILFGVLVGGEAVVETIFTWQGVGQWALEGSLKLDVPVMQGFILTAGAITLGIYLLLDVMVGMLDPRISLD